MQTRNAVVGFSYCIVSLALFVLNGLVLLVLLKDSEYKTSTYRIIKSMCVASMLQLLPFFVGGLMTLSQTLFHFYVDRIFGVQLQSAWFLYLALSLTLAIDRLVVFAFQKTPTFKDKITNCLLIGSLLFWLFIGVILSLPGCGYSYAIINSYMAMWSNTNEYCSLMISNIEGYFDLIVLAIILLIYLIVFGYLVKARISLSVQSRSFIVEMRILLVAVVSFCYETLLIVYGFWVPPLSLNPTFMEICLNTAWVVDCGLFVTVTLIINKRLREKVLALVPGGSSKGTAVQSLSYNQQTART